MTTTLDAPMEMQSTNRTEYQLKPHEGPTGIKAAERRFRTDTAKHTPRMAVPQDWTRQAKCLDDWKAFAPAGEKTREPSAGVAAQLCADCPVLELCLSAAMGEEGRSQPAFRGGIRGGLTPVARYNLAKGLPPQDQARLCNHSRDELFKDARGRWRCKECARIADARIVECSCGRVGPRGSVRSHRWRTGCGQ